MNRPTPPRLNVHPLERPYADHRDRAWVRCFQQRLLMISSECEALAAALAEFANEQPKKKVVEPVECMLCDGKCVVPGLHVREPEDEFETFYYDEDEEE